MFLFSLKELYTKRLFWLFTALPPSVALIPQANYTDYTDSISSNTSHFPMFNRENSSQFQLHLYSASRDWNFETFSPLLSKGF
jgi:hypothetical protein